MSLAFFVCLFKITLIVQGLLGFHMNVRIFFYFFVKKMPLEFLHLCLIYKYVICVTVMVKEAGRMNGAIQ